MAAYVNLEHSSNSTSNLTQNQTFHFFSGLKMVHMQLQS